MNMTEKTYYKELDSLKADIERLREEIAGLTAGVKESAGIYPEQSCATTQQEVPTSGKDGHGVWVDLLHKLNASRIQGEKVVRDLATEVEKYPLVSIMTAFGLGYIIAKLWYQESKQ
jgi:hypothetical protein